MSAPNLPPRYIFKIFAKFVVNQAEGGGGEVLIG